jgi:hypothetical protein
VEVGERAGDQLVAIKDGRHLELLG